MSFTVEVSRHCRLRKRMQMAQDDQPAVLGCTEGLGAVSEARYLASDMRPPGGGPRFRIGVEGRHIIDEDFIFDAMLKVDGDFDDAQRAAYAQWICDALNEADKTLPREPRAPNVEVSR